MGYFVFVMLYMNDVVFVVMCLIDMGVELYLFVLLLFGVFV